MFNVILTTWFMMFLLSKLNILISLTSWKNAMIKEVKYVNGILMVTLGIVQKCLETRNTYEEFVKCVWILSCRVYSSLFLIIELFSKRRMLTVTGFLKTIKIH